MIKQMVQKQVVLRAVLGLWGLWRVLRSLGPAPKVRFLRVSDLPYNNDWKRS